MYDMCNTSTLDSVQSEVCIVFTMMYVTIYKDNAIRFVGTNWHQIKCTNYFKQRSVRLRTKFSVCFSSVTHMKDYGSLFEN